MSINQHQHVNIDGKWFLKPYFEVGEQVKALRVSTYSSVRKGREYTVSNNAAYERYSTEIDPAENAYVDVYRQKIKLRELGNEGPYIAHNFESLNPVSATLAIENTNRPCLVWEFKEVPKEESTDIVREYVGDIKDFTTLNLARMWVQNQITESIRKDNVYRKFAIFPEASVAQAKEPQIEFK